MRLMSAILMRGRTKIEEILLSDRRRHLLKMRLKVLTPAKTHRRLFSRVDLWVSADSLAVV
jgi:hypothetical protein